MLMKTSLPVFFWISCFSLSTSCPLRPMMMPRGEDADLQLVGGPLHLDPGHAGVGEALLELPLEADVLVEQVRVFLLRVPAAAPGLVEAQAEPGRMYLLTHQFDSRSATLTVRWVVRLMTW
jgi:hypothetical protein